ncbi:phospholipase A [Alteromonas sp. a30]|nr:phospholipase A [Alteromonas sp. a30]
MSQFASGKATMTLAEIRLLCKKDSTLNGKDEKVIARKAPDHIKTLGPISRRLIKEEHTAYEPFVITPHKMNYLLPALTTNEINREAYSTVEGYQENLAEVEAKFQLSLKLPLLRDSLLIEGDALYVGFTLEAWWQIYSDNISKPFRETNYRPEIFYAAPLNWHPLGGNTGFVVGVEHESNGRAQYLSRSWNRVYGHFLFEKDNFAMTVRPWARINEDEKEFEFDPDGDDNPDIEDYLGHFELGMVYEWDDLKFSFMGRQNFATHNGAVELGFTFPLWGTVRGYATAFSGYGESLIDYNHKQTRVGVGIALNDIF